MMDFPTLEMRGEGLPKTFLGRVMPLAAYAAAVTMIMSHRDAGKKEAKEHSRE